MFVIIGIVAVIGCVLGSYMAMGGKLGVLNQPFEFTLIFGAGASAFIIANPMRIVKGSVSRLGGIFKGPKYKKADYLELLTMQYQVFKLIKQKGALAVEQHVENPHDSKTVRAVREIPQGSSRHRVFLRLSAPHDAGHGQSA